MDAKSRELTRSSRESSIFEEEWNLPETTDSKINRNIGSLWNTQEPYVEFEDELVRNISFSGCLAGNS